MRSWIFVPGHNARMLDKAFGLDVDVVMLDLEDGVVPAQKAEARALVALALGRGRAAGAPARYVRVNGFGTAEMLPDLEAVVNPDLDGIVVPKVRKTVDEVRDLDRLLARLESAAGAQAGRVRLMLAIESAEGPHRRAWACGRRPPRRRSNVRRRGLHSRETWASPRFARAWRANSRTRGRPCVVAAAAARVASVDGVSPDLEENHARSSSPEFCILARALGFTGKSIIHPAQATCVNRVFRPTPEEVAYATRLVAAFEEAQSAGTGSINFGGMLVDRPIYERARATVQAARATRGA